MKREYCGNGRGWHELVWNMYEKTVGQLLSVKKGSNVQAGYTTHAW